MPWSWIVLIQIPWFGLNVVEQLSRTLLTFTLQPHALAPWLITLLTSFNALFNLLVGAPCNYASDRIWTRWGRRRPFLIAGHLAAGALLIVLPLARGLALLILAIIFYEMLRDLASPTEPLEKEVVPVPQRGRGQAITNLARTAGVLFFSAVLLAQFDARYDLRGTIVTGEQVAYWAGAVISLAMAAFYCFCVREVEPPARAEPSQRTAPATEPAGMSGVVSTFVREVFGSRQNWAIYVIGITMTVFWSSLGNLAPLLVTEQFGYSKPALAWLNSSGQIFALLVVLPVSGWVVDRFDRANLFQGAAVAMTLHHAAFYVYARHFSPGGVPPMAVLMAFALINVTIMNVGVISAVALQFDYIAASQMGTISAGIGITRTAFELLTRNVIGAWVTVYSAKFATAGRIDYLSGYQYLVLFALGATAAAMWFVRLARSGRLVPHGRIEQERRSAMSRMA